MRRWTLVLAMLLAARAAAQERVPDEEAKQIAAVLVEAAAKLKAPLKVEPDAGKPYAKKKDDYGALLLPAKGLTAAAVEKAGAEVVPVGHLWLRSLAPVVDDKVVSSKKLQIVPVTYKDRELNLALCYLGVRKVKDQPVLVLLGKDATPVVTLPLEKADVKQEFPLEFLVTIEENERATLTLQILGKYRTKLPIGAVAD